MNKTQLLKQRAAVEQAVIDLREQRAGHAADLVEAQRVITDETAAGIAARLRRMTYSPKKLQDAQTDAELLPGVINSLDRQIIEAQAPLAGIERELARLQAEADLEAARAAIVEVRADAVALAAKHARALALAKVVWDVPQEVMRGYEKSGLNDELADVAALHALAADLRYYGVK